MEYVKATDLQKELLVDDLDVPNGVHVSFDVRDVGVLERPQHHVDSVYRPDV